jgi:hypothetical protein
MVLKDLKRGTTFSIGTSLYSKWIFFEKKINLHVDMDFELKFWEVKVLFRL